MVKIPMIPSFGIIMLVGFVIFAEVRTGVYTTSLKKMWSPDGSHTVPKDLPEQEALRDLKEEPFEPAPTPDVSEEAEPALDMDGDLLDPAPMPDWPEDLPEAVPALDLDNDRLGIAPTPDLEEVRRELEPTSNVVEQVSEPEIAPDLQALPQPTTSLDLEELSKSVQSDLTLCSDKMQYFRTGMSPECRKLWREDLFARPLPERFVYVHIPKAGTSFTTTLRNYLPQCTVKDVACPYGQVSDEELRCNGTMAVCNGHQHVNAEHLEKIRQDPEIPEAVVSMIRDPALRVISAKNHDCHRDYGNGQYPDMEKPCEEYDLEGFADLPYIQNCQTKMMNKFFCAQPVEPSRINPSEAKHNLFNLDFFGITDHWNRSIRMFHCQFGGELRESELMNSRPGVYSDVAEEDTIDYIRDVEKLDSELYRYALDLFLKREECMKCPAECS